MAAWEFSQQLTGASVPEPDQLHSGLFNLGLIQRLATPTGGHAFQATEHFSLLRPTLAALAKMPVGTNIPCAGERQRNIDDYRALFALATERSNLWMSEYPVYMPMQVELLPREFILGTLKRHLGRKHAIGELAHQCFPFALAVSNALQAVNIPHQITIGDLVHGPDPYGYKATVQSLHQVLTSPEQSAISAHAWITLATGQTIDVCERATSLLNPGIANARVSQGLKASRPEDTVFLADMVIIGSPAEEHAYRYSPVLAGPGFHLQAWATGPAAHLYPAYREWHRLFEQWQAALERSERSYPLLH